MSDTPQPPSRIGRRRFLRGSACAAGAALAARGVGLSGLLTPARVARAAGGGRRFLVLLRLNGGNDGLNTVIPHRSAEYLDLRPTLRVTEGHHVLADHDTLALRPEMARMAQHYAAGRLAIVQAVGYAPASLSHFRSEVIWQSGDVLRVEPTGWIGRWLDTLAPAGDADVRGFDVAWGLDHVFLADHANTFAFPGVDGVYFPTDHGGDTWWDEDRKRAAFETLSNVPRAGAVAAALAQGGFVLSRNVDRFAGLADLVTTPFPDTDIGRRFRETARLIAASRAGDIATGVFHVGIGGFDTHSVQDAANGHPALWSDIDASLDAFHAELTARGAADDVLVLAYSEFGRRVEENGSAGTDHGTAAPMFAFGNGVLGGVYGPDPDLTDLDADDNLKFHTDFREVYATVLAGWLGADPDAILRGTYAPVPFLPG